MIRFTCPFCKKLYKCPDDYAGKKMTCKQCGEVLIVPDPTGESAPLPSDAGTNPSGSDAPADKAAAVPITPAPAPPPKSPPPEADGSQSGGDQSGTAVIRFACPRCMNRLRVGGNNVGAEVGCPKCGQKVIVPAPLDEPRPGIPIEDGPVRGSPPGSVRVAPAPEPLDLPDDEEEVVPRRRPRRPWRLRRRGEELPRVWKTVTLLGIGLSGLGFFLPWVRVSCWSDGSLMRQGRVVLGTQSGLQMIYVGFSPSPLVAPLMKAAEEQEAEARARGIDVDREKTNTIASYGAFRLLCYPFGLALAVLVVFASPTTAKTCAWVGGILGAVWLITFLPFTGGSPTEAALIGQSVKDFGPYGIVFVSNLDFNYEYGFYVAIIALAITAVGQGLGVGIAKYRSRGSHL
jgi:hypothetical protein